MPRVLRRPRVADDILEVWDYVADDSIEQADAWVDRLDHALGILATQPMMGRARPELEVGLRSLPFERYVIFYLPLVDGVDVVRVLHSARDVDAQFSDDDSPMGN